MILIKTLKNFLRYYIKPLGRINFILSLPKDAKILDVGCGNNGPLRTKIIKPGCNYTGIDIENYNQSEESIKYADKYILTTSENFVDSINNLTENYDAVISTHNLEHCVRRNEVLKAMCKKVKNGGYLYLSFPSKDSIYFPSRKGTLNYFDDITHLNNPPNVDEILEILKYFKFFNIKKVDGYKPIIMNIFGNLIEPYSILRNKVCLGTWEKWGFESIIIAHKGFDK
tara:strand:- start:312 stop:992 length:681 start_codon:yes stop_codon:yes gene_type:complete